jgi:hypothetical protein
MATYAKKAYFCGFSKIGLRELPWLEIICHLHIIRCTSSLVLSKVDNHIPPFERIFYPIESSIVRLQILQGRNTGWLCGSNALSFAGRMAKTNHWTNSLLKFDRVLLSSSIQCMMMCCYSLGIFILTLVRIPLSSLPFPWETRLSLCPLWSISTLFYFLFFEYSEIRNLKRRISWCLQNVIEMTLL